MSKNKETAINSHNVGNDDKHTTHSLLHSSRHGPAIMVIKAEDAVKVAVHRL